MMHTKVILLAVVLIAGAYTLDCSEHPMTIMAKGDDNWLTTSVAAPAKTELPICSGLATT